METVKSIVILSGPVGAGKSTVAPLLVATSPGPAVYIEGDKFWFFFAKGAGDMPRGKNFKTIMASMTAASLPYARAGYEVILDFSMPPWFLDTAKKLAGLRDIPLDYVVLRPGERVCAERAAARIEGVIADYSAYKDLYASFDTAAPFIIQDDESDAVTIAARVRKGLNEGKFRLSR